MHPLRGGTTLRHPNDFSINKKHQAQRSDWNIDTLHGTETANVGRQWLGRYGKTGGLAKATRQHHPAQTIADLIAAPPRGSMCLVRRCGPRERGRLLAGIDLGRVHEIQKASRDGREVLRAAVHHAGDPGCSRRIHGYRGQIIQTETLQLQGRQSCHAHAGP
ncbi:hypothetical protein GCM10010376_91420 [Streptomyces violaceusniger]